MATKKSSLQQVLDLASDFVNTHKGRWEHAEWEDLLSKVEKLGFDVNDATARTIGNILESCKYLYNVQPDGKPAAKRPAAKKASTTRRKSAE